MRNRGGLFCFLILFVFYFHSTLFPEINVAFDRILRDQVYASSDVSSIVQDPKGFIWFGTTDGLFRYDGYNCKGYKYSSKNSDSISHNNIKCLYLDSENILWIGTQNGLNKFDWETDKFTWYLNDVKDTKSLSNNNVQAIYEDRTGDLWIGTESDGLNRFDRKTGKCERFIHDGKNDVSLGFDKVKAICEDSTGVLWIGTEQGLNRFNREEKTFKRFYADPEKEGSLSNDFIWTIYNDRRGILWIGTWGGLNKYSREKEQFVPYESEDGNIRITSIYEDRHDTLWVGTRGKGLYLFERESGDFTRFRREDNDLRSLSQDKVNVIYEDDSGILWIGTLGGGINTYNRRKEKFSHFGHHPGRTDRLSDTTVFSIYEDPDEAGDILWVGTYSGLNRINRKENKVTYFKNREGTPHSISDDVVRCISEDKYNILWLGTDNGLNQFDRKTQRFTSFHFDERSPTSISFNGISTIYEDEKGFLWIGTAGGGLNRFNREDRSFIRFKHDAEDKNTLSSDWIFGIHQQRVSENEEYVLWIGTYEGGLNKFFVEENRFLCFNADSNQPGTLSNDTIRVVWEDKKGILWLGTDGGLNRFDPVNETFSVYAEEDGLANNVVYGILEDEEGYLWLSTDNGLFRFDKEKQAFKRFHTSEGLQVIHFTHNSYCKSKAGGEMFFGGTNGFFSFFPSEIKRNTKVPKIVITDFKIFNKSVGIGPGEKLKKSITETNEIVLNPNDYLFSFDFAALDFTWPDDNSYSYKMENFREDWIPVNSKNRSALYMNLDHGTYTFRVKGSNNDGVWNDEGVSLKIIVTPPFSETWWFRVVVGLILIFCVMAGYKWRTKLLRNKLEEKERVQKILEQSKDEMEKSRNLAEFRSTENEKLIAAISSIFIAVDAQGNVFQWNHSSKKFFRMPENHVKDRPFVELLEDYVALDKLEEIIQLGLHREKPSSSIEIPVRFKISNESNLLLATINPIIDRSGRKFGFLLLAEDITHRKKEQMQRFLSQKLEALGQMAAGIAHEIRSPLQYIGDNGRFLQEAFESLTELCNNIRNTIKKAEEAGNSVRAEALKQFLEESDFDFFTKEIPKASEQIVNGVTRVSNIVKSMNEFAHTGDGVSGKSDLNEMLKTTLVVAHNRLKKVAEIETDYARDLPGTHCGMGELNQVFLNLLLNAADAIAETGNRGVITVSTTQNGNELIVRITDNGIGIPEENKDKIFTPFFTTKSVGKGTGQGLPFSYRIVVERHKGRLYFDSQVGKGSTFYIHLPIQENPSEF